MWSLNAVLARDLTVLSLLAAASSPTTPQQEAAYRIGYQAGLLFGALLGGAVVGLLPLILGLRRGRRTFAFVSWACCIAANFLLGIFLSIPVAVVLTVVVCSLERRDAQNLIRPQEGEPVRNTYESAPVRGSRVEQPDYAGSPLWPR